MANRERDPRQLPVQLNIQVPWSFREHLIVAAKAEGTSVNKLVNLALMDKYGKEYLDNERKTVRLETSTHGATQ